MQFYNVFVKIINGKFVPMNLPVGHVWEVNGVLARYLVEDGSALVCNSAGTLITPPWRPTILSADVTGSTLTLHYDMDMAVTNDTGITVYGDAVLEAITNAVASGTTIVVNLTTGVAAGQEVFIHYDELTGNIVSDIGTEAKSLSNYIVVNNT